MQTSFRYYVIKCINERGDIHPGEEPIPCESLEQAEKIVKAARDDGQPWKVAAIA